MNIEDLDTRIGLDEFGVPTITLGCGRMTIAGVTHAEYGGVSISPSDKVEIGEKNYGTCGKTPEEIGASIVIRATKIESLEVLKAHIQWAIDNFGIGEINDNNRDVDHELN